MKMEVDAERLNSMEKMFCYECGKEITVSDSVYVFSNRICNDCYKVILYDISNLYQKVGKGYTIKFSVAEVKNND